MPHRFSEHTKCRSSICGLQVARSSASRFLLRRKRFNHLPLCISQIVSANSANYFDSNFMNFEITSNSYQSQSPGSHSRISET
jgi:hypothetical protein